jgi:L-2,4-diaminobutyrate decarboxylase
MGFYENGKTVLGHLNTYYNQSIHREKPVILQRGIRELHEKLDLAAHLEKGDLSDKVLDDFLKDYLDNTTRLHHPGYFAHQVGNPHPTGALGSLIDGFTNNAMAIYEMGPAAAAIEFFMVNYLLKKIGWETMPPEIDQRLSFHHGAGVLTHGGSLANMTALLAARNHLDKTIRENGSPSDLVILAPETSHYSVAKAAGIIGVGENNVIGLETDTSGRIRISRCDRAVCTALDRGKRIIALVANACSTGTGIYDPIDEIADLCREKNIWFHVDGAHGGGALFSSTCKGYLKGVQKADSMIIDAHKMLRTPVLCAALLVRDAARLDHAFEHKAGYLFHEKNQPGFDFIGQVIECTKAGLGLKFFMTLAAIGEQGIQDYIDNTHDLARQAFEYIQAQPDFEAPVPPESNILCFRFDAPDPVQIKVRDQLIEEGNFYISSTELNNRRFLRIVIINPETRIQDIKDLVVAVRTAGLNQLK